MFFWWKTFTYIISGPQGKWKVIKNVWNDPLKPLREHLILFIATHIPSAKHCYNFMLCPTWKLETNSAPSWWNYIYNGWITNKIMFYSRIICLVYRLWDDNQFTISDVSGCVLIWVRVNLITDSTVYILCLCVTGIPHFVWRCLWLCWWLIMTQQDVITQNCATLRKENWARVKTSPVLISRITFSLEKNRR